MTKIGISLLIVIVLFIGGFSIWQTQSGMKVMTKFYLNEGQTRHFMRTCLKKLDGNVEIHRNKIHGPPSYNLTCRYKTKNLEMTYGN